MTDPAQTDPLARAGSFEQRFRASLISSTAIHVGAFMLAAFGPMLWPDPILMPDVVPVKIVRLPPPRPTPPAPVEQEPEAAEEPEPVIEPVQSEPEPIPENLEQLRRQRDEERRQREQEAERRRREEEERRRREEEERRRQPQKAARRNATPPEPQRQEAERSGTTFAGAETDDQSFTVEEFPFTYYVVTIRDKVSANWKPPARGAYSIERRVLVYFRIGRDGRLVVSPRVDSTSGDSLFDQAAQRAIAQATPFPPLPREYAGQSLGVRFAFVQE